MKILSQNTLIFLIFENLNFDVKNYEFCVFFEEFLLYKKV